jgi:hypothetical protein
MTLGDIRISQVSDQTFAVTQRALGTIQSHLCMATRGLSKAMVLNRGSSGVLKIGLFATKTKALHDIRAASLRDQVKVCLYEH